MRIVSVITTMVLFVCSDCNAQLLLYSDTTVISHSHFDPYEEGILIKNYKIASSDHELIKKGVKSIEEIIEKYAPKGYQYVPLNGELTVPFKMFYISVDSMNYYFDSEILDYRANKKSLFSGRKPNIILHRKYSEDDYPLKITLHLTLNDVVIYSESLQEVMSTRFMTYLNLCGAIEIQIQSPVSSNHRIRFHFPSMHSYSDPVEDEF